MLRFAPSGALLVAGYSDGNVRFVDMQEMTLKAICRPEPIAISALGLALKGMSITTTVTSVDACTTGELTLVGTESGNVHLLDSRHEVISDIRVDDDVNFCRDDVLSKQSFVQDHVGNCINAIETSPHDDALCVISDASSVVSLWRLEQQEGAGVDAALLRILSVRAPESLCYEPPASHPTFVAPTLAIFSASEPDIILYSAPSAEPGITFYNFDDGKVEDRRHLMSCC